MKRLSVVLLLLGLAGCDSTTVASVNTQAYEACNEWELKVSEDTKVDRWCRIQQDTSQYLGYEERRDDQGNLLSKGIVKHFTY